MISVVVPTLNEEKFIAGCLSSIRGQSVPCELIVVDGGSSDATVEIARAYADRVILLKRRGIALARDYGARIARGDIIVSADADCVYPQGWLKSLTSHFDRADVVAVGGSFKPREPSAFANVFAGALTFFASSLKLFAGGNMAFRKGPFLRVGGYKRLLRGEDWNLSSRLAGVGRLIYEPSAVCYVDVPANRKLEMMGLMSSTGAVMTAEPLLTGFGTGFLGAEAVTALVSEPGPIHHSHVGLAGLVAVLLAKKRLPDAWAMGLGSLFSGITLHHIVTEDVLESRWMATITPLWLGTTLILLSC